MKALIYHGSGRLALEDRPRPTLQKPTDAIVRIEKTTICGTDLHILRGHVPTAEAGRILGHEGVGIVVETGTAVQDYRVGDRVLISCITACRRCPACAEGFYGHCDDGGWILGNVIDGCQAEYVRIPHIDGSAYPLPHGVDADAYVMLSDILPTGLEVGVEDGQVKEGSVVAVIGAGPVGLATVVAAALRRPSRLIVVDLDAYRLEVARSLGATDCLDNSEGAAARVIMEMTHGRGVDVAIEAIGTPPGWYLCEDIVASGGNIAILGVHGKSVTLHLERMWKRNFTLTAGLVHTTTIPKLKAAVDAGTIDPTRLISHHFGLSQLENAYDVFGNAARHQALKVILSNDCTPSFANE
jgi:alcohol dehydrogenase